MVIFRDYTTDELIMNLPCDIGNNVLLYPTLVKDYKKFNNYIKYIIFGRRHLQLPKETSLLKGTISFYISAMNGSNANMDNEQGVATMITVLNEMCEMFSMITRSEITYSNTLEFSNSDKSIVINDKNFDIFRMVVLKMNMLREPKIYEREIDRKWEEKALIAKRKNNKNIELGEILTVVRNTTHEKYEDLINMNVFQLYCDYFRIQQVMAHKDTALFATVSDKIKPTEFIDSIFEVLYRDPTKDLNVKNDFTKFM